MNPHVRNGIINELHTLKSMVLDEHATWRITDQIDKVLKIIENYKPRRIDMNRFHDSAIYRIITFDELTPKQRLAYALTTMIEDAKVKLALLREVTELAREAVDSRGEWVQQYVDDIGLDARLESR